MGVLKYNSVRYGGGVDIQNTMSIPLAYAKQELEAEDSKEDTPAEQETEDEAVVEAEPEITREEILAEREAEIEQRENELQQVRRELAALKEQYIEQGKQVIIEAKRRAEGIISDAENEADGIRTEAENNRESIYIKARAEGFEQGKKDGVAACLSAGQVILDDARDLIERINDEKNELFAQYEKEIYETVMEIANKVTMDSMSVKDGTAARKLIKKAAKEFRNSQILRITLNENGATTELAGDYEFLKDLCLSGNVEVELIADASPGTVIVDNGEEITDAGIQTQLKMIRELGDGKFRAPETKKKRSARKPAKKKPDDEQEWITDEDPGTED